MKLLGKQAGHILWEILGPVDGRNRWSDGVNGVLVAPAVDIYLSAPTTTAVRFQTNVTPLVLTGFNFGPVTKPIHDALNPTPGATVTASSPRPVSFGSGQRPDPSAWVNGPLLTSAGTPTSVLNTAVAVGTVLAPIWIRLIVAVAIPPGQLEGYVRLITKWS